MRYLFMSFALLFASQALASPDPEKWFVEDYGSLWLEEPWTKVEEIYSHYTETVVSRSPGESPVTMRTREWMGPSFDVWRAEGWVSSEVVDIETDRLNETVVVFKTRWRDDLEDGSVEYSCGWYLADLIDGQWKNSQYATIDCAEHGFAQE